MYACMRRLIPCALLIVLLSSGCQASGEVQLDEAADGSQVTLETGQTLVISLPSNITTGFSWELSAIDNSILSQLGEPEYISEAEGDLVGAGGTETFRFTAETAGLTKLVLIYHQPFDEGVEPADTFSLTIEVH